MAQQITLPEPYSDLRNDEDNFAVKSPHYIRRLPSCYRRHLDQEEKRRVPGSSADHSWEGQKILLRMRRCLRPA